MFLEVAISRATKDGQRAFIHDGQAFTLSIPLTATITPFEFTAGYRFRRHSSIVPYAGAGVGSYGYTETSSFAEPGDDVDEHHVGLPGRRRRRVPRASLVGIAADVQYTHVPGILGDAGISKDAGEDDLGGVAVRAKVMIGVGH